MLSTSVVATNAKIVTPAMTMKIESSRAESLLGTVSRPTRALVTTER